MTQLPAAVQSVLDAYTTGSAAGVEQHLTPDAVMDGSMPGWRYRYQGPHHIVRELRGATDRGPWHVQANVVQQGDTVVVEVDSYLDKERIHERIVHVFELRGAKIAEWRYYCCGEWDEAVQRQIAAEAPHLAHRQAAARG